MKLSSTEREQRPAPDDLDGTAGGQSPAAPLQLSIRPARMVRWLAALVIVFAMADVAVLLVDALAGDESNWVQLVQVFEFDRDLAVPTWYSIILLAACSVTLGVIAEAARLAADPNWLYWLALAVIFAVLSVDEQAAVHESVGMIVNDLVETGGIFYFTWVIPAIAGVIVAGIVFLPFLRSLPPSTRIHILAAAALYVGGALGAEMVSGAIADDRGVEDSLYTLITSIEEVLEILGISYFLVVLVAEIGRRIPAIVVTLERGHGPDHAV